MISSSSVSLKYVLSYIINHIYLINLSQNLPGIQMNRGYYYAVKNQYFSGVQSTSENADIFIPRDEIYIYFFLIKDIYTCYLFYCQVIRVF